MPKGAIMVVEDEPRSLNLVRRALAPAGYKIVLAASGEKALHKLRASVPDLIVIDLLRPGINGLDLCKILKRDSRTADVPIIILAANASELDRILALELGAEDYVLKPFNPRELAIRVERLLGRQENTAQDADAEHFSFESLSIDLPKHEVTVAGKPIGLTPTEFKLLIFLAQRRDRVQSRDQLLRDVWGCHDPVTRRTVDTHMRRLRSKLGRAAKHLDTVRGFGYRFLD